MKKLYDKLTNNAYFLKGTIGVGLCLLALVGALNTGVVSNFITWIVAFVFGWTFYIFYFILFLVGLRLIFSKKKIKIKFGITIGGIILLIFGLLILTTNGSTYIKETGEYLSFTNFFSKFSETIQGFPQVQFDKISGGFLGFLIVALLNSGMTNTGSIIFGIVFVVAGAVLALIKPTIKVVKKIKKVKADKNSNVEYGLQNAQDVTQYDTDEVESRPTTVVTANDELPTSSKQTTVIRNPNNGGVGTAYINTSVARNDFKKAKFDPKERERTQDLEIHESEETYHDDFDIETTMINSKKRQTYTIDIDREEVTSNVKTARFTKPVEVEEVPTEEDLKAAKHEINNEPLTEKNVDTITKKPEVNKYRNYQYPSIDLLVDRPSNSQDPENIAICEERVKVINQAFQDFNVGAKIVSYTIGPSVTRYDVQMNRDQSSKTVNNYVDDIANRLEGIGTRYVQVVPGRTTSGLEIPNKKSATVSFKDCTRYLTEKRLSPFTICFGKDIGNGYVTADLREFPHLLVCGTTGSGKSVFVHSLIVSLIMRNKPSELKLLMIDPKHVEFNKYKSLPFLIAPIINDAKEATLAMNQLCDVMEERYRLFEDVEVDSIEQYNKYAKDHNEDNMPYIIVVIDEYADLVDSDKQVSSYVTKLCAKARACGIHLVVATQRPSTDVITGVIKSNIPTRVAMLCAASQDSQTILGVGGAEKLLGNGDMLVKTPLVSKTENVRVQGSYIGSDEIKKIVGFLREHYEAQFEERFCNLVEKTRMQNDQMKEMSFAEVKAASDEEQYIQIREHVMLMESCSISKIVRSFNVGFNKAGKIFDRLASEGIIEDHDEYPGSNKGRKVLLRSTKPETRSGSIEQSEFNPNKL